MIKEIKRQNTDLTKSIWIYMCHLPLSLYALRAASFLHIIYEVLFASSSSWVEFWFPAEFFMKAIIPVEIM